MRLPTPGHVSRVATAALALTLLTACSGSVSIGGTDTPEEVPAADLQQHIEDGYSPEDGVELTITCPEPLAAEVDATAECTVEDQESETGVRFTTTSVDGGDVDYETTPFLRGEVVAETITAELERQGYAVDSLECPEDLDGVEESTTECSVGSQGEEGTIAVSVTEVDGLRIGFNFEVV